VAVSEVDRLGAIMDLMREKRALRVKVEGLEVELSPLAFPDAPPVAGAQGKMPIPVEEARCPCGCPLAEHGEAGCFNGCPDERCQPATEAAA
jgi:hypothetical protein